MLIYALILMECRAKTVESCIYQEKKKKSYSSMNLQTLRGDLNLFRPHGEGAGYGLFQRSTPGADIHFQRGVLEPRSPD